MSDMPKGPARELVEPCDGRVRMWWLLLEKKISNDFTAQKQNSMMPCYGMNCGGGFASNQWFECLPRLIGCSSRRRNGHDFFATFSFSPCGRVTLYVVNLSGESRTSMARNLLQGARHAVLGTLCARAHRIGSDGTSCLLDGLRKNVSFSFFVVVVVCVLVCQCLKSSSLRNSSFRASVITYDSEASMNSA